MKWSILIGVAVLAVGIGGYYAYQYVKYTPPEWLIAIVTKKAPPPPLPAGNAAPIQVPEGFVATIFSRDTPGARVMLWDQAGNMLVSETEQGKIVALPDHDHDGVADEAITVLSGLNKPHGILESCEADQPCVLYVAETDTLKSYVYNAENFTATYQKTLATFPTGNGHFTRTLLFSPDGKSILISIGSSCNACNESSPLRASVQSLDLASGAMRPFATGLRNSVFMAYDPLKPGSIWATENGRDILGDDIPPDEINILQQGKNYGWPICYGQNIHDTDFDKAKDSETACSNTVPAWIDLQAHSAALGLAFIPETGWPRGMAGDLLVALHGSWNRSTPTGYKVVRLHLDPKTRKEIGAPIDFATGFLPQGSRDTNDAIGRPVGVIANDDGTVYISDDRAGAIYKVAYLPQ